MNGLLTRLGISPEIQAFFDVKDQVCFNYGDQQEIFSAACHVVPTTRDLWLAGNPGGTQVIVSYSVMEIMAYLCLNRHRYPRLGHLALVAIGNRLCAEQTRSMANTFPGRRFTLVFGNDLVGRITAIKVTAGVKNLPITTYHAGSDILIDCKGARRAFDQQQLSLHAFQEAFHIRPRFHARKPAGALTFLDQLKNDAQ